MQTMLAQVGKLFKISFSMANSLEIVKQILENLSVKKLNGFGVDDKVFIIFDFMWTNYVEF